MFSAIASAHGESMPVADTLQYGLAALFNNLVYATVAFTLALLTRSMAGGMALALVFAFVIDSAARARSRSSATTRCRAAIVELMTEIAGSNLGDVGAERPEHPARARASRRAGSSTLIGVSAARFTRSDVE